MGCCCCNCWKAPTTRDAYRLSIASLVITLLAAYGGIYCFVNYGSSLCLVFGMENMIDFLSSTIVLWRFFAPRTVDDTLERSLRQREQRASVAISFTMIILGFAVVSTAIKDFLDGFENDLQMTAVIMLSFLSIPFFVALTMLKFRYAAKLDSVSLHKDGVCSLIGTIMSVALLFNTLVVVQIPEAWWMDPICSMIAGLVATFLGIRGIRAASSKQHLPIFTIDWWHASKKSQEKSQRNLALGQARSESKEDLLDVIKEEGEMEQSSRSRRVGQARSDSKEDLLARNNGDEGKETEKSRRSRRVGQARSDSKEDLLSSAEIV